MRLPSQFPQDTKMRPLMPYPLKHYVQYPSEEQINGAAITVMSISDIILPPEQSPTPQINCPFYVIAYQCFKLNLPIYLYLFIVYNTHIEVL